MKLSKSSPGRNELNSDVKWYSYNRSFQFITHLSFETMVGNLCYYIRSFSTQLMKVMFSSRVGTVNLTWQLMNGCVNKNIIKTSFRIWAVYCNVFLNTTIFFVDRKAFQAMCAGKVVKTRTHLKPNGSSGHTKQAYGRLYFKWSPNPNKNSQANELLCTEILSEIRTNQSPLNEPMV